MFSLPLLFVVGATLVALAAASGKGVSPPPPANDGATAGSLQIIGAGGTAGAFCPLKHTDVKAEVSGFLSRVTVTQRFENSSAEKIEAVYAFPLPRAAAVDDMTLKVGERTVRGKVMRREEAQAVYAGARAAGQVAGLLDQERPNVFTQSVANIMPGEKVTVTISYVETLKYEDGTYEFSFPAVVGPRYVPGVPTEQQPKGNGFAPDTDKVPDASRITPHPAPAGVRAGHDLSIEVALDAGLPVESLQSPTHEVDVERAGGERARVRLKNRATIPNKDFVFRYDVAGRRIGDALLTHRGVRGGYFTLVLQPPERVAPEDVTPKELVFVLDTSGSMQGFPLEKAKEAMGHALDGLNPQDTFNLITFAGDTHVLFPQPVPATKENLRRAQAFLASRSGAGGTEMMKAVRAALAPSGAQAHVRVVCFMTDGYVGNEFEIINEVQKHPNARVFSFGIGSSVNRFLLDKMAEEGRGEVEYVSLGDDGSAAARRFHERVRNPLLTDISVDWGGLPVADVYPRRIPDLFGAKPVVLSGRFEGGGRGLVRLKGRAGVNHFEREITVELPESQPEHDVLATLWARRRVEDLMSMDYAGAQRGNMVDDVREAVTRLGIDYRLMTQFTSFVAVEEMTVTDGGGPPRRIDVPVELPEGVSREGVFGRSNDPRGFGFQFYAGRRHYAGGGGAGPMPALGLIGPGPVVSGGVLNGKAVSKPAPQYPAVAKAARATGTVSVLVTVDEGGKVVAASPVSGHALLTKAAVDAARQARFAPTLLSGKPVKTTGIITYNFALDGATGAATVTTGSDSVEMTLPETEEQKLRRALDKLHPSLAAIVERLKDKSAPPTADEARLVRDGKAEVHVWLTEQSPEVVGQLKRLGFEVV
ncbi:MAG TPA: TonB family protein, partial [Pyrinomonadaceae bacterium]